MTKFKKALLLSFLVLSIMCSSGCVYLVIGGVGALGGYVVSPDTVEGILSDYDQTTVWDTALEVVSIMGVIREQSDSGGLIIARVQGTKVTITTVAAGTSGTKLSVKARRSFLPRIRVAQEVYAKIVNTLGS